MSDLLLASVVAMQRPTLRPDPVLADALSGPPTTLRAFPASDTIAIYAEVYDNDPTRIAEVETSVAIIDDQGQEQSRSVETHHPVNGVVRVKARLPLAGLQPGGYTLAVEARHRTDRAVSTGRAIALRIVDDQKR